MVYIKKLKFRDHRILGNLELDFTVGGKPVDTIILAGENGCGKTAVLNCLYAFAEGHPERGCEIIFEKDGKDYDLFFEKDKDGQVTCYEGWNSKTLSHEYYSVKQCRIVSVYSEADTNYVADKIDTVKPSGLDGNNKSRRSGSKTATEVNQLLSDMSAITKSVASEEDVSEDVEAGADMTRLTCAFEKFFGKNIGFSSVVRVTSTKEFIVRFKKGPDLVSLNRLSSGERQVIYRTVFLLWDQEVTKGCLVLLDEPERALHPMWQDNILDYYKDIFCDEKGHQESQIIVATHSPFIIQNSGRYSDKVVLLGRDGEGKVVEVKDATFCTVGDPALIESAFFRDDFNAGQPMVYVRNPLTEKYLNDAMNIYRKKNPDVRFGVKYIGDAKKDCKVVRKRGDNLKPAEHFLRESEYNNILLYDFDEDVKTGKRIGSKEIVAEMNREGTQPEGNVWKKRLGDYVTSDTLYPFDRGIERLLDLNGFNEDELIPYLDTLALNNPSGKKAYGIAKDEKENFCDFILGKSDEEKGKVYVHLFEELKLFADWLKMSKS